MYTFEELPLYLTSKEGKWIKTGHGNYNAIYYNEAAQLIFKIPLLNKNKKTAQLDKGERPAKLWNVINPHKNSAKLHKLGEFTGWVCPFIEGRPATDSEISREQMKIYDKTHRIVIDAPGLGNFITFYTEDNHRETICVDVGLALLLNKDPRFEKSQLSLDIWEQTKDKTLNALLKLNSLYPKTIDTIKALLYLQEKYPAWNSRILQLEENGVKTFSQMYDLENDSSLKLFQNTSYALKLKSTATELITREEARILEKLKEKQLQENFRQLKMEQQRLIKEKAIKKEEEFKETLIPFEENNIPKIPALPLTKSMISSDYSLKHSSTGAQTNRTQGLSPFTSRSPFFFSSAQGAFTDRSNPPKSQEKTDRYYSSDDEAPDEGSGAFVPKTFKK